ncbi:MAG: helix-turn-helix domain-containing protein [Sphingorhabdus sp.]
MTIKSKPHRNEVLSYSVKDACEVTGLGKTKMYQLIRTGQLDVRKIGRRTVIPAASLHGLIDGAQAA